jgi:hypothetical protein
VASWLVVVELSLVCFPPCPAAEERSSLAHVKATQLEGRTVAQKLLSKCNANAQCVKERVLHTEDFTKVCACCRVLIVLNHRTSTNERPKQRKV